jgi:rRNA maturation protein Nop10
MRSTIQKRVSELPVGALAQRCPACGELTLVEEICGTVGESSVCIVLQRFAHTFTHEQALPCPPDLGAPAPPADPGGC